MRLLVGMSDIVRSVPHNYMHVNTKKKKRVGGDVTCTTYSYSYSQLKTHIACTYMLQPSLTFLIYCSTRYVRHCLTLYITCSIALYHHAHIHCITAYVPYWGIQIVPHKLHTLAVTHIMYSLSDTCIHVITLNYRTLRQLDNTSSQSL